MTAVYEQHGIRFQYPENWQLQQSLADDDSVEIVLETPSGSFWLMHAKPDAADADDMLKSVVASLDDQYEGLEVTAVNETIANCPLTGFDAFFYCFDFLVKANIRIVQKNGYSMLLLCQAESREFEQQELVFKAITTSLLSAAVPE